MEQTERLGKERIPKLLFFFAAPSICSLVLHSFYNIVDRMFIGRCVGGLGLAGVAMSFPVLLILFGVCLLFSSGGGALISLKLGEQKEEEAGLALGNVFTLITIAGIVMTIVGRFFCKDLFLLFHVSEAAMPHALAYMETIFMGSLLFLYGFSMAFIIRAEGNPLYATAMIVTGTLVNVTLDYFFIVRLGMGTRGAALATISAEAVVALMGVCYIVAKKGVIHIKRKNLRLHGPTVKQIAVIGLSPALMDVAASLQLAVLNATLIALHGDMAVAAMGVVFSIGSLMLLFTFGMAGGMQPIIGYNYGAGRHERVRETLLLSCKVTFVVSVLFVLFVWFFAEPLAGLFSNDGEGFTSLAVHAMRVYLVLIPLANVAILVARFFQAIGKGWRSTVIGVSRQVLIFLPVLYLCSSRWGLSGVFYAGPLTDLLAMVVAGSLLLLELKKRTQ